MEDTYECTLSEECLQIAKRELNENPADRLSSIQALRQWIEQQPHITCRTDKEFLLKFLRTAKFSQLRALELIEGYLTLREIQPYFLHNWDPHETYVKEFLQSGMLIPLPGYINGGVKVIIYRPGKGNVAGRFKGFWHYNDGPVLSAVMSLLRPFTKKKILDRLRFYGNSIQKLYKDIPKSMLPLEYLPDDYTGANAGTVQSLTVSLWEDLTKPESIREFAHESDPNWRMDKTKKAIVPSESFRKLTID